MADNREGPERPVHEMSNNSVKLDQVRNAPGNTLLRAIPANQQTRFMMATPVQSSTALISTTSTIQAQVLPKVTVQGNTQPQMNRISAAVPIQVSSPAGYHVPRGAAAVANIAVPRSSVATPMIRAPTALQTIGVATGAPHAISGSTVPSTGPIVGRSVVGVTPWVTTCLPQQVSSRQTPPPSHQIRPPPPATQQMQVNAASRLLGGQMRTVGDTQQTRPVLLHTTAHKQITLAQPAQLQSFGDGIQQSTSEKTVAVKSYGGITCNTQGNRGPASASASNLSRLATALPSTVVSLQPAVIVPTTQTFPVKATTTAHAKVITQQTHGTTMQISTVPVSSVQPTIAINTVVSRPGVLPGSQGMRINSVMVVDSSRVQVHPFVTASDGVAAMVAESGVTPTGMSTISLSGSLSHSLMPKQNTSPRPSILRKRDPPDGTPLKAQKNLTPVLANMASSSNISTNCSVSPPPSATVTAPGSPRLQDSTGIGGGSSQSSTSSSGTGSTTLSANSSPGESPPIKLDHQEEHDPPPPTPTISNVHQHQEMSPRKKPRKQQLTGNQITEPAFSEDEMEFISEDKVKIEPKTDENEEKCIPKKTMSLMIGYRHPWKSRSNHFLRYSDIRPKEERKPTLSELANQKHALQKLNGWKIYHLNSQMEDMVNSETEFFGLYSSLLSSLEIKQKKCKNKDIDREFNRVNERIRANFQRSKVLKDQIQEAKGQVMKLFDHKSYVADIINRNVTKRPVKKK